MPPGALPVYSEPLEIALARSLKRGLLPPSGPYACAVSGGQDSVALLLAMKYCAPDDARVAAIHIDHGLRDTSADDGAFVRRLCRKIGVLCVIRRFAVDPYAKRFGLNLEEAARSVRYRILANEAARLGTSQIITAHTADDQAETVLIHLIRGSGLEGLSGMSDRQEMDPEILGPVPTRIPHAPRIEVIRPLLGVRRSETADYCASHQQAWLTDHTNDDVSLVRNRIRHHLLPLLETYNASVRRALLHLAHLSREDADALSEITAAVWNDCATESNGGISIPKSTFVSHPRSVGARLVRHAALKVGARNGLSYDQVDRCLRATVEQSAVVVLSQYLRWNVESSTCTMSRVAEDPRARSEAHRVNQNEMSHQ